MTRTTLLRVTAVAAALSCLVAAVASGQAPSTGYRIGPRDLLDIKVFEVPELNIQRRVDETGTIELPLIGGFPVKGLTAPQAAASLQELLESRYVQRASVSVEVREFRSRPITVIGAVKKPGELAVSGRWTLLETLAAAGGLSSDHGGRVLIHRTADSGLADQVVIDIQRLMYDADPDVNIPVFAGDLINVPATTQVSVFCLGEVASPGALSFNSRERLTLLTAISRAGGLTERAGSKLTIRRTGGDGESVEIKVDYRRVVKGKDADVPLEPNDVVIVRESFF